MLKQALWWIWIVFPTWISNQRLPENTSTQQDANASVHGNTTISDQPVIVTTESHIDITDIPIGHHLPGWTEQILTPNDTVPAEFIDSLNNGSLTIFPKEFHECVKARELPKCMHFIRNISFLGNNSDRDLSLNSMYDKFCTMSSQQKTINSSRSLSLIHDEEMPLSMEKSLTVATEVYGLPLVSFIIDIIGSGNDLIVILVILLNHRIRKPFYMSILSLCISDFLYFVNSWVNSFLPLTDYCGVMQQRMFSDVSLYSVKMFSTLNVVLMASVRYVMFVYPLKSRVHLTNRLIVALSFAGMVFSIAYGTTLRYISWSLLYSRTRYLYIIDDAILLLALVILNTIFLFHRLRVAKTSQAAHNLKLRMTLVVITILILHIIKSLYTIMNNIWRYDVSESLPNLKDDLIISLGDILSKLVLFIHPFLFFFSSSIVIKEVASLLNKCNFTK